MEIFPNRGCLVKKIFIFFRYYCEFGERPDRSVVEESEGCDMDEVADEFRLVGGRYRFSSNGERKSRC